MAREAWRSMKANRVQLSFGYLATQSHKRADGVIELTEIDLFEVSIVGAPANVDTRILSVKAAGDGLTEGETERNDALFRQIFAKPEMEEKAVKSRPEPTKIASFDA